MRGLRPKGGPPLRRRFLLEWLSFAHRYIPIGLLEEGRQAAVLAWRNPGVVGRSALETRLASDHPAEWVALSEMLLGRTPPNYVFIPKHKAQVWPCCTRPLRQRPASARPISPRWLERQ